MTNLFTQAVTKHAAREGTQSPRLGNGVQRGEYGDMSRGAEPTMRTTAPARKPILHSARRPRRRSPARPAMNQAPMRKSFLTITLRRSC